MEIRIYGSPLDNCECRMITYISQTNSINIGGGKSGGTENEYHEKECRQQNEDYWDSTYIYIKYPYMIYLVIILIV